MSVIEKSSLGFSCGEADFLYEIILRFECTYELAVLFYILHVLSNCISKVKVDCINRYIHYGCVLSDVHVIICFSFINIYLVKK